MKPIGFALLGFVGALLSARLLGPRGRGELTVLILIPSMLTVFLELALLAPLVWPIATARSLRVIGNGQLAASARPTATGRASRMPNSAAQDGWISPACASGTSRKPE